MECLDQTNRVISRATMVNLQLPLVSEECRPDIFTRQALVHFPVFIQQREQSSLIYRANKMKTPFGDWQLGRQGANLSRSHAETLNPTLRLYRRRAVQRRRLIVLRVPLLKLRAGTFDRCQRIEMLSPPEALIPQTIGSFDHTIPLGFVRRNEDRLNAEIQTQADEAPENARRFVAATESRVVVHLQSIGASPGHATSPAHGAQHPPNSCRR